MWTILLWGITAFEVQRRGQTALEPCNPAHQGLAVQARSRAPSRATRHPDRKHGAYSAALPTRSQRAET